MVVFALAVAACGNEDELKPFTSDGCSLFPDASVISEADWCECCFQHDLAYWRGGTAEEREQADVALRECVQAKTDNAILATTMYEGVRVGGSPYFYTWYRWGYGWNYGRNYAALTKEERGLAEQLEQAYFESNEDAVCAR